MAVSDHIIERKKDILGGTPVFKDTMVPVQTFFEYLEAGHSVNDFFGGLSNRFQATDH